MKTKSMIMMTNSDDDNEDGLDNLNWHFAIKSATWDRSEKNDRQTQNVKKKKTIWRQKTRK